MNWLIQNIFFFPLFLCNVCSFLLTVISEMLVITDALIHMLVCLSYTLMAIPKALII